MGPADQLKISKSIIKATDAKLKSDNWKYILDVCDLVRKDPEDFTSIAIESIQSRLSQENANILLRTLTLIISLAENCGSRIQQEFSNKSFTNILYTMLGNHNIHKIVKKQIIITVRQLSKSFKSDPSLRGMSDLYKKIKKTYPDLVHEVKNDNRESKPNVPVKKSINGTSSNSVSNTNEDNDDELQKVLELSLKEYEQKQKEDEIKNNTASNPNIINVNNNDSVPNSNNPNQQIDEQKPAVVKRVRAMYDLTASEPGELSFKKGDIIKVIEQVYRDWWRGSLRGTVGIFPLNYVNPIAEPTELELRQELQKEAGILSQKDNVDQLYNDLQNAASNNSNNNMSADQILQNPQINNLYGTVTPLRPQITKLIAKYSNQKNDLNSLRQVLSNAEATYNQLLDRAASSYTIPNIPQPQMPLPQMQNQQQQPMYSSQQQQQLQQQLQQQPMPAQSETQKLPQQSTQNFGSSSLNNTYNNSNMYNHNYNQSQPLSDANQYSNTSAYQPVNQGVNNFQQQQQQQQQKFQQNSQYSYNTANPNAYST
ncbi:hypothetical protein TBLA_0B05470 [Henningerozyma blattae CBS 6284]|uniref:Class E vacuolar protein-sorting machinery protein HSE1 n=1 Tax=Henningerozyma blattae (strain ATCC 34711 / CBS 6284 / DSM 70876 / NBRC 10599 / NRRL Y-10934 / UCD 77-7) TaxID=1071380 RepID=I2GZ24_HENB6|nr:hypothetical protein TBLA_0B05470 [Tetrapisispora blattae CBS 6284]CCH59376.1 hypothetical protein TBLA_0B05470 [Tetrapisispora blattae CBS 6284]